MATEINAGRVAMVPKGEWSASTAYTRLDVVQYNGSSYVAIQDSTGQNPSTATTYWQLLASGVDPSNYYNKTETNTMLAAKQDALVSGQNIKSINGQSVLGAGNMTIHEEQLIEKSYAPAEFSGLGRKYLQKNIVDVSGTDKNVLTQAMMQDANTIYVIQYDYDLNGQSVTLPSGCVLQFDGGSLNGGTLVGNDTAINADIVKIFSTNVTLLGTWNVAEAYPEWFGAKRDNATDDYLSLQNCINFGFIAGATVRLSKGTYLTSKPLLVYGIDDEVLINQASRIEGSNKGGSIIQKSTTDVLESPYTQNTVIILVNKRMVYGETGKRCNGLTLSNFAIHGGTDKADYGIYAPVSTAESTFSNLQISRCVVGGFVSTANNYLNLYKQIRISSCGDYGFKLDGGIQTSDNFINCYVTSCAVAYKVWGIYMQMTNCCADGITDTVFDLRGFNGTVTAPGSESVNAKKTFVGGQYTNVTVINPLTFGNFTDEDACHITCNAGGTMKFVGGNVLYDNTGNHRTAPGWLYDIIGLHGYISFDGTFFEKSAKKPRVIPTGRVTINEKNASLLLRHTSKIPFIGSDTATNSPNTAVDVDACAIYMGFGNNPTTLTNGDIASSIQGNNKGDIILSKCPDEIGAIGWVNLKAYESNVKWRDGDYRRIPFILNGSSADRASFVNGVPGQTFFDTSIGKQLIFSPIEEQYAELRSNTNIRYFENTLVKGDIYNIEMIQGGSSETIKFIFAKSDSSIEEGIELVYSRKEAAGGYYSYYFNNFIAPDPVEYPYVATVQDNTSPTHYYYVKKVIPWAEYDGIKFGVPRSGAFANKPAASDVYVGFQYFNTDTHKMISCDGTKWYNPDGTEALL